MAVPTAISLPTRSGRARITADDRFDQIGVQLGQVVGIAGHVVQLHLLEHAEKFFVDVLQLRKQLDQAGLDAGADTIARSCGAGCPRTRQS